MKLTVPGMMCDGCAETITKAIAAIDPAAQISISLADKTVTVDSQLPATTINQVLADAGYEVASGV